MTLNRGNYGWKFNSLLLKDDIFNNECKQVILNTIENSNPHIKCEYLKYQSSKFAISFSKRNKKEQLLIQKHHENVITQYETTKAIRRNLQPEQIVS